MSMAEKELLIALLKGMKEHMDDDPTLDEQDMEILQLCMEIPAGYEDLLQ